MKNTEDRKMELLDTNIKHILYDKISKLYFTLDETGNFIKDIGDKTLKEAETLLDNYSKWLNGEMK